MSATTPTRNPAGPATGPLDRLPRAPLTRRARAGEVLRGLAAGAVLIAVLAGVPWALLAAVGNPLPTGLPQRSWLEAELSTGAVLDVLALVLWALWLHFALCVALEVRAWASGAPPARPVPGGPAPLLARRLVAAALLVVAGGVPLAAPAVALDRAPATTGAATGAATATADPGRPGGHEAGAARPAAATPAAPDPAWVAGPAGPAAEAPLVQYVVQPPQGRHHDCLWDIAERTLGDPLRYREVFELNRDRVQADGSRLLDADLVRPGWTLLLPADAVLPAPPPPGA